MSFDSIHEGLNVVYDVARRGEWPLPHGLEQEPAANIVGYDLLDASAARRAHATRSFVSLTGLFARSISVYPYTLAVSSTLA